MARRVELRRDDEDLTVEVGHAAVSLSPTGETFAISDGGDGRFAVQPGGAGDGDAIAAVAALSGDVVWVGVHGYVLEFHVRREAAGAGTREHDALYAPMPATVVRIAVKPGDAVTRGDTLLVLEAMKMELPIRAPRDMVITAIHCREGDLVQPGVALVE
jgi:3-methylcrotonyl-CoA carboxylase alpha subunit